MPIKAHIVIEFDIELEEGWYKPGVDPIESIAVHTEAANINDSCEYLAQLIVDANVSKITGSVSSTTSSGAKFSADIKE